MVADAIHAVQRNLRVVSRIIGAGREDRWEIELEVIREAVVNALMHRDYSPQARGTQVQIEVYPDRVTVSSPGGLFGNVRLETLGQSGISSSRNARLAALLQEAGDTVTGRPVAENRGSGISMMIDRVRQDTGVAPLFAANLDQFRVTIPRTSPVTQELLDWAAHRLPHRRLTPAQLAATAMARAGYDVDLALIRRLAPELADPREELGDLIELGLLRSRKARDDGPYRLSPEFQGDPTPTGTSGIPAGSLAERIIARLRQVPEASREDLQNAAGASRSKVTQVLQELLTQELVEATEPTRSPNRRYRLTERGKP
jgi:ATP-dependent DNA helicase RecG